MSVKLVQSRSNVSAQPIEIVERKGIGHPDTLADLIAATTSNRYSRLCREKFGVILPHWFDKVVLAGAKSNVNYGVSDVVLPIRAYLFGKTTHSIGGEPIDTLEIFKEAARSVLGEVFPNTPILDNVQYESVVHDGYGPDHPNGFYNPTSAEEVLTILTGLRANDTSVVTAYAGYSDLETLAVELENFLNSQAFKQRYPETGTDIKAMLVREGLTITTVICIPFIGSRTPSFAFYSEQLSEIRNAILGKAMSWFPGYSHKLFLNTKDSGERAYLTAFGSALDKGDCGAVGRGNRYNGLITPYREMSIEAASGKNPTHHVGKLYSEAAFRIARDIYLNYGINNAISIVSHNGDDLKSPSHIIVSSQDGEHVVERDIHDLIECHLAQLPEMVIDMILTDPVSDHVNKPRQMYPGRYVAS